jgi:hypothetical protein
MFYLCISHVSHSLALQELEVVMGDHHISFCTAKVMIALAMLIIMNDGFNDFLYCPFVSPF